MRILTLTDYFYPHIEGGVEHVVYEVNRRLAARGHQLQVLTLNTDGASPREVLNDLRVCRASAIELTRLIKMQSAVSFEALPLAWRSVRAFRPDVIHAHGLFFSTTLIAVALKFLTKIPLITTMHVGAMDELRGPSRAAVGTYERIFGRAILHASDRVIAVSAAVADHARSLGARDDRVRLIPNGVDVDAFHPCEVPLETRPPVVAFVGRLIFNKGPHLLVDAARAVLGRWPDARFVVVGDGPLRDELEATTRQRELAHAFRFLGVRDDVAALLREATVLVRPSLSEGMPLTVLEAMACGLPVVASAVGGTPEVVEDGVTGYLVRPGCPRLLAEAIEHLLEDRPRAAAMGARGRQVVESQFSWDRAADRTMDVYGEICGKGSRITRTAAA